MSKHIQLELNLTCSTCSLTLAVIIILLAYLIFTITDEVYTFILLSSQMRKQAQRERFPAQVIQLVRAKDRVNLKPDSSFHLDACGRILLRLSLWVVTKLVLAPEISVP